MKQARSARARGGSSELSQPRVCGATEGGFAGAPAENNMERFASHGLASPRGQPMSSQSARDHARATHFRSGDRLLERQRSGSLPRSRTVDSVPAPPFSPLRTTGGSQWAHVKGRYRGPVSSWRMGESCVALPSSALRSARFALLRHLPA